MDRISQLTVRNIRTLGDVTLDFAGVTVVIGDNGVGKSTLVEVCEIVRRLARSPSFFEELHSVHRLPLLLKHGEREIELRVRVESDRGEPPLEYRVTLGNVGLALGVVAEELDVGPTDASSLPLRVLTRGRQSGTLLAEATGSHAPLPEQLLAPDRLAAAVYMVLPQQDAFRRLNAALSGIETHLPVDTLPLWASAATHRTPSLRGASPVKPTSRLELLGLNLASAYQAIKNGAADWSETLEILRLGLGDAFSDVYLQADAATGNIALSLQYGRGGPPVPAAGLSDGTLAWLAFVAMHRLRTGRSLLALDEVERHLHPRLLGRVLDLCESMASDHPVLLTTHSDRLLDMLADPAGQVVLAELGPDRSTALRRPDPAALERWLQRYAGYGTLRTEGYEPELYARGAK